MELLAAYEIPIQGRRAVVLGRSDIVGKPMAALLTARDATVTVCHSKTRDVAAVCREADILVAAIGRPGFVTREFVREGAAVVDVGINRVASLDDAPAGLRRSERIRRALAEKGRVLVGDVDFDDVAPGRGLDHARAGRRRAADGGHAAEQHDEGLRPSDHKKIRRISEIS